MEPESRTDESGDVVSMPLVVLSQTFPARPSSFPEIRSFVLRGLADSSMSDEGMREIQLAVSDALLQAAGAEGGEIQAAIRIFQEHVEVDVLRTARSPADAIGRTLDWDASFAAWMQSVLRREGLTQEAAARQLGVSVKTVSRWVTGASMPRPKEIQRVRDAFGDDPRREAFRSRT